MIEGALLQYLAGRHPADPNESRRGMSQTPSIGRIVHYTLTEQDTDAINRRRADGVRARTADARSGAVIHYGNTVTAGDVYPAMVVRVWEFNSTNLQVFLDGNDTYWAASKSEGDQPGTWHWPERV